MYRDILGRVGIGRLLKTTRRGTAAIIFRKKSNYYKFYTFYEVYKYRIKVVVINLISRLKSY